MILRSRCLLSKVIAFFIFRRLLQLRYLQFIQQALGSAKIKVPTIDPATGVESRTEKDLSNPAIFEIWGVKAEVEPGQIMLINEEGYPVADMNMQYKIQPTEYKYLPQNLNLDFYEKDKNGNESWMGFIQADANGNLTLSRGTAKFNAENTYYAELVLHRGTRAEIWSEKTLIEIAQLYIEKVDPEFSNVKLRWNDYYPALDEKTIVVRSATDILEGKVVNCEILEPKQSTLDGINPSPAYPICNPFEPTDGKVTNGKVKFKLNAIDFAPMIGNDQTTGVNEIKLKFSLQENPSRSIEATYNVKNNSNTTLKEVLDGEAVFVYDTLDEDNHKGKTASTVTTDADKKLDFVQELLNQIVPRKRSVTNYTLIEEDGIYDDDIVNALNTLKTNFNISVNTSSQDMNNTFKKLMKDYDKQTDATTWLNRIVEKEVLVGRVERNSRTGTEPKDNLINTNTSGDAGLYELYDNVVKPFINRIIEEAERYAGLRGAPVPTDNWIARTGQGNTASTNPHGPGMSYCYGCKDEVNEFNLTAANCRAESTNTIRNRETDNINGNEYRGNINNTNCVLGTGNNDWAGLTQSEYNLGLAPFTIDYWAGIDCSGLAQRSVNNGRNVATGLNITIPLPGNWIRAQDFFTNSRVFYITLPEDIAVNLQERNRWLGKLRKGDLVRYDGHISIIYSNRPNCGTTTCTYEIIHAYGTPRADLDNDPTTPMAFTRKVVITPNNMETSAGPFPNPTGFGRIKLWD